MIRVSTRKRRSDSDDESIPPMPQGERQRPSELELMHRVERVMEWLSQGASPARIREMAKRRWGVTKRTTRRYLARAVLWRNQKAKLPLETELVNSIPFFDRVLQDPDASYKDKIAAMREKIRVLAMLHPITQKLIVGHEGEVQVNHDGGVRELIAEMRKEKGLREGLFSLDGILEAVGGAANGNGNGRSHLLPGTNGTNGHGGAVQDPPSPCDPR